MEQNCGIVLREEDMNIRDKPVTKLKESPVSKIFRLRCSKARSKDLVF